LILSLVRIFSGCINQQEATDGPPIIILIMADDVGTGDISCYGTKLVNTPNIDKLAAQGTRFDEYYTAGAVNSLLNASQTCPFPYQQDLL